MTVVGAIRRQDDYVQKKIPMPIQSVGIANKM
jgi:hypothetical protein